MRSSSPQQATSPSITPVQSFPSHLITTPNGPVRLPGESGVTAWLVPVTVDARIYCTEECRIAARTGEDIREKRTCRVCDDPFEILKTTRRIYCSPTCRKDASEDATRLATKTGPVGSERP